MEKDEAVFSPRELAKTHISVGGTFGIYAFVQLVSGSSTFGIQGFFVICIMLCIDIAFLFIDLNNYKKLLTIVRYVQLVICAYMFLITLGKVTTVFLTVFLVLLMLELIFLSDLTDSYIRKLLLFVSSIPSILIMILYMIIQQKNQDDLFAMLCSLTVLILFIGRMSYLIAQQVVIAEKKLFEQRRLAESTNEANAELTIQQEKVKKANDELGFQKIKLEAAYNKINSVNSEMTIQNQIIKYISGSLEINTLMELITESISESFGLQICAIILQPKVANSKEITFKVRTRLSIASEKLLSDYIINGSFETYVKSKEIFIDNYVQSNHYPFLIRREIGSLLIIPLVMDDEANGALICGHSLSEFFIDNLDFFETIVAQFLIALHNADMYTRMKEMAIRDSLTGIFNRGYLNTQVDYLSKIACQKNEPLSVALLDIDRFKKVNDTFGHLFGDEVIKKIAELTDRIALNHGGIAARYGGEEFVMVFPNTETNQCLIYAEELRTNVMDMQLECDGQSVFVRVSVGIASYPQTCNRIQELLGRADEAMYYSKNTGRDKVTVDTSEIHEIVIQQKEISNMILQ